MAKSSERDAAIYDSCAAALVKFATGLVGVSDAADVVHNAVLRTITSRAWPRVENHRSYLYRAVLNEARSHYRSAARRRAREQRAAVRGVVELPEVRPDVFRAVGQLSVRQRAVVVLTYWEDLDEITVADRLGISPGTVRSHLGRARAKLRSLLDE